MSFSGTPLGQGRRLDHSTFLGKPPSNGSTQPSYAYGAPALGSRSPPKPVSPSRDRSRALDSESGHEDNEPALQRFARLKQRESATGIISRPGGPKTTTESLKPDKWPYKDTSVNIANAFVQAASGADMSSSYTNPHNASWASSRGDKAPLPRSTSEDYENHVHHANKRLAPPPDKLGRAPTTTRKPPSKAGSSLHVPDSEEEANTSGRAKSPLLEHGLSFAKQALGAAAFYVRQQSREPENLSNEHPPPNPGNGATNTNGNDSSYDYAAEEQDFQASKRNAPKRGRISVDNKAYKPSLSDDEYSEYSDDDGKKRRKRKSKKGPSGGPLTTLPVVAADKRRRRKGQGSKPNAGGQDESESDSDENTQTESVLQSAQQRASLTRTSNPPVSRGSVSRLSQEPPEYNGDDSLISANQGLESIPEIDENALPTEPIRQSSQPRRGRSRTPAPHAIPRSFSVGGLLGTIVHIFIKLSLWIVSGVLSALNMLSFLFGQVFGTTFDIVLRRPIGWAWSVSHLGKYVIPGLVMVSAWYILQNDPLSSYLPSLSFPSRTPIAPPPSNVVDLANRILRLDTLMLEISNELKGIKHKVDDSVKRQAEILGSLSITEDRLSSKVKNVADSDAKAREDVTRTIRGVQQHVEVLQSQLVIQQKLHEKEKEQRTSAASGSDEDARAQIRILEEKLANVQGSIQEALELGKKAIAAVPVAVPAAQSGPAWWNKITHGSDSKSTLQIKSADGQDVTGLVSQMVDSAVSRMSKDTVAKADYALFSGGAVVIPRLTSPLMEIRPRGLSSKIFGLFSGGATYVSRPPTKALHPDMHNGQCWPFAGTHGRLGVALAFPIHIEEFTIDHIAKELAYEMLAAPRDMEVWGMVEGKENVERVSAWKADRAARAEAGEEESVHDSIPYPSELPKNPEFVRLANFTYDINAPSNVQTFSVDPEIKELGIDVGIVVLRVLNNWGRDEFTCLYRFRVHGERIGPAIPKPLLENS
ncbi:Spindle pole body-associated protein sad1 [Psilocybe cubensis]|uniref:SUN domain-containing protein n=2 Tax=Psilocybe cubensis TaxID=181762 RepID=A0A8H8CLU0_PSICU|nr:Spindle pole body-associated protein sad1 [Psilocybe cubensis]KAH9481357.1 Spindle pole body-associated protein sad1 [Psilocybe cubensis]